MIEAARWTAQAWADWRDGFAVRRGTPMLLSYPKCGATWLRFLLSRYFVKHFDLADEWTVETEKLAPAHPEVPRVRWHHDDGAILLENGTRPDPRALFRYGGRWRYRHAHVALLVRDPRDVVVSYYHQVTKRSERPMHFEGGLSAFVRDPLHGFERVVRYYRLWAGAHFIPRRFLLVRYEGLVHGGPGALGEVVRFFGIEEPRGEALEAAWMEGAAGNMRQLERAGAVHGMRGFGDDPDALKVRKARIGAWREELPPEDVAYCNERLARVPSMFGYSADDPPFEDSAAS